MSYVDHIVVRNSYLLWFSRENNKSPLWLSPRQIVPLSDEWRQSSSFSLQLPSQKDPSTPSIHMISRKVNFFFNYLVILPFHFYSMWNSLQVFTCWFFAKGLFNYGKKASTHHTTKKLKSPTKIIIYLLTGTNGRTQYPHLALEPILLVNFGTETKRNLVSLSV